MNLSEPTPPPPGARSLVPVHCPARVLNGNRLFALLCHDVQALCYRSFKSFLLGLLCLDFFSF